MSVVGSIVEPRHAIPVFPAKDQPAKSRPNPISTKHVRPAEQTSNIGRHFADVAICPADYVLSSYRKANTRPELNVRTQRLRPPHMQNLQNDGNDQKTCSRNTWLLSRVPADLGRSGKYGRGFGL